MCTYTGLGLEEAQDSNLKCINERDTVINYLSATNVKKKVAVPGSLVASVIKIPGGFLITFSKALNNEEPTA